MPLSVVVLIELRICGALGGLRCLCCISDQLQIIQCTCLGINQHLATHVLSDDFRTKRYTHFIGSLDC